MRRKVLSVVLCVCMMMTMAPFAFAEENSGTLYLANEITKATSDATITLPAGEYTIPTNVTYTGKTLTIKAAEGANVSFDMSSAKAIPNADITFENVTFNYKTNADYTGLQHATKLTYNNCKINSKAFLYAKQESFTDCIFNQSVKDYNIWCYGSGDDFTETFTNCTFNGQGKFVHVYRENADPLTVTLTDCKFVNNAATADKSAINIKETCPGKNLVLSNTVSIQNCTTEGAFPTNKNGGSTLYMVDELATSNPNTTVYVNNEKVWENGAKVEKLDETNSAAKITTSDGTTYYKTLAAAVEAAKNGDTIKLLADINGIVVISKIITLDLNGYTIEGIKNSNDSNLLTDSICPALYISSGNLTLEDTSKAQTGKVISRLTGSNTRKYGSMSNAVYVNGTFTLKSGTLLASEEANETDLATNDRRNAAYGVYIVNGSSFIMENGNIQTDAVNGNGYGVALPGEDSTFTMKNGTIETEGFGIAGNGNGKANGTVITIQDGTVIGGELAIYHPQSGTLNIEGGTLTGKGGIETKAGNTTVSVTGTPVITATGTPSHGENNNGNSSSGYALSVVENNNYAGGATVSIGNGYFKGLIALLQDNTVAADKKGTITITGGYFSTNPSAYCSDGLTGVPNTTSTAGEYPWTVGTEGETGANPADIVSSNLPASVPENAPNDVVEAAKEMDGANMTGEAIKAAVTSAANENNLNANSKVAGNNQTVLDAVKSIVESPESITVDNVKIVYQTYIDVELTDVTTKTSTGDGEPVTAITELTVNLTPKYRVIATTNSEYGHGTSDLYVKGDGDTGMHPVNSVLVQDAQPLTLPEAEYEVTIQVPNNFPVDADQKVSVKHEKQNGTFEYYTGTVMVERNEKFVTFTTNGFSPFTISAAAAFIGDTAYPTLQEAVDNVKDNETIKLAQNVATNAVVTVARTVKFNIDTNSKTFDEDKNIVAGSNTTAKVSGTASPYTYEFTYTRPSHSSSGSTTTSYNVNVTAATNGTVTADKKTAAKGATVTVTATPSAGYVVEAVKVVDKDGKDVAVTAKDGKYVFTMPGSAVTVTGSFKAETPAESGLPFVDVKNGDWFYDAVKYAYENGLMTGTSATTFAPNGTMNRAMIVTVLYRLEKSPAVTAAAKFTDVPAGQWYSDAVAWAAANGIVNGYDETTFGPMNAVTREQLAAILFRYEQVKGLENVTLEENLNRFPDKDKISAYAVPALQWAVGQKVINGNADGTLDPTGTATRAQVAQILMNLLK